MIPLHKRASSFLALGWLLLQLGTVVHAAELEGMEETPSTSSINGQVSGALEASGLSVILESSSMLMESSLDALGQFSFEALPAGEYVVKLSGYGYDLGAAQHVSLAEDESASLDFEISPLSSEGFLFEWKDDASSGGTEISSYINQPLEVTLLGAVESIGEGNYHQYLWNEFSILLSDTSVHWSQEHAYRLLETFHQLMDDFLADGLMPSVWELSNDEIENDVTVEQVGEEMRVVLSHRVFTYASPLIAEVEGKRGTYFSKRLHHACLRFLAEGEMGRSRLERVLENRFGVQVSGLDYTSLTQWTTGETADRFQPFHMEELIQIINTFEEMPEGFHKIPNLKYLARRQTGMDHPLYPSAPAVAWTSLEDGYIEFVDTAFTSISADYLHRLIIHEKAHFIYGVLLSDALMEAWHEVGGWYENPEDPQGLSLIHI